MFIIGSDNILCYFIAIWMSRYCRYFQGLALDVIGEAAFGVDMNAQQDSSSPLLLACKKSFEMAGKKPWIVRTAGR